MLYFDSAFIARYYLREAENGVIRDICLAEGEIASCDLARTEVCFAFHRKWREGDIERGFFDALVAQFQEDIHAGTWLLHPVSSAVCGKAAGESAKLARGVFLRSADAIHLTCAREMGCKAIYSNDRHLLAAANHFGLKGINLLG